MKTFNEKHEAIIVSEEHAFYEGSEPKEGTIIPHHYKVNIIEFYQPIISESGRVISNNKVQLSKQFIFDLYTSIKEIEDKYVEKEYSSKGWY